MPRKPWNATPIPRQMPVRAAVATTPVAPLAAWWEAPRDATRLAGRAPSRRLLDVWCTTLRRRPRRRGLTGADEG